MKQPKNLVQKAGFTLIELSIVLVIIGLIVGGVLANEPIYYGLGASLIAYVVASLLTPRTAPEVLQVWDDRLAGKEETFAAR